MIPFLTAQWKNLIVVNFEVRPEVLKKYLPRGTELDYFHNKTYVSLVAFNFNYNKFLGLIPTYPTHSFEEFNLRFYIKKDNKRGVAFIKEVVPSKFIAYTARLLYQEPYIALPTASNVKNTENCKEFFYSFDDPRKEIYAKTSLISSELTKNTLEEFILEHYWGYTAQADASTIEYQVTHPKWRYFKVDDYKLSPELQNFYGKDFVATLSSKPASIFVAEGSDIAVSFPKRFFHPLKSKQPNGWILYDGLCGFCSWWIPLWKNTFAKIGYDIAPVQKAWVQEKINLDEAYLNNDIRLLLNDDSLINGADVYIFIMKRIWWLRPLGIILGLPIFRQIIWICYKFFNRNRFLVSKVCKFKPEVE